MARCPACGEPVPPGAKYCPRCGAAQPKGSQFPLAFSPWERPVTVQPGGGAAIGRVDTGTPMSMTQVGIAVGSILLFLLLVIFLGRGGIGNKTKVPATSMPNLPVLGARGEAVQVGNTVWGVAFIDQIERVDNQAPQLGQFYTVGVIIGNKGKDDIRLSTSTAGLVDLNGVRYTPRMTAWGTPDQIQSGRYANEFTLPPDKAIAGLIIFDVPTDISQPRLMVRDLTKTDRHYSGVIDLTKEAPSS